MKKYDITAMGELIIDFTRLQDSSCGNMVFEGFAGGGAANALAAAAAMGCSTAFAGGTGNDIFGNFLKQTLENIGVNTSSLCLYQEKPTGIGFVSLDESGERSFLFYRDSFLEVPLLNEHSSAVLSSTALLHLTSVSMTNDATRDACFSAMKQVQQSGGKISYDINYREKLWKSYDTACDTIMESLKQADIIKLSESEADEFFPGKNHDQVFDTLRELGASVVLLTLGSKGCRFSFPKSRGLRRPIPVKAVDTTGSGDAFYGAVLASLVQTGGLERPEELSVEHITRIVDIGNAAGALCAQRYGSLTVMPTKEEVEKVLRSTP